MPKPVADEITIPELQIFTQKTEPRTTATYTSYARNLQRYLNTNQVTLQKISALQCKQFIQQMGGYNKGTYRAVNTADAYKRFLHALMTSIERPKTAIWIKQNLKEIRHVNHFKVDITIESITRFILNTKQPEYKFAFSMMAFDGLRPGEVLGLYHADINIAEHKVNLIRHEDECYFPKGAKLGEAAESVPFNVVSAAFYPDVPRVSKRVVPVSYKTLRKWFTRYAQLSNLQDQNGSKVTLHKLRHFLGHYFRQQGGDVMVLKEILRHSDLRYTQIYTTPSSREVTAEFEKAINNTIKQM
jgi:site-specific recombinase XerD